MTVFPAALAFALTVAAGTGTDTPKPAATPAPAAPAAAPSSAAAPAADAALSDRLAKCAAAYTLTYSMLKAIGQEKDALAASAQLFWDAAKARSDAKQVKERFTVHYKAYLARDEALRALPPEEAGVQAKQFLADMNADMDDCGLLGKKLGLAVR